MRGCSDPRWPRPWSGSRQRDDQSRNLPRASPARVPTSLRSVITSSFRWFGPAPGPSSPGGPVDLGRGGASLSRSGVVCNGGPRRSHFPLQDRDLPGSAGAQVSQRIPAGVSRIGAPTRSPQPPRRCRHPVPGRSLRGHREFLAKYLGRVYRWWLTVLWSSIYLARVVIRKGAVLES